MALPRGQRLDFPAWPGPGVSGIGTRVGKHSRRGHLAVSEDCPSTLGETESPRGPLLPLIMSPGPGTPGAAPAALRCGQWDPRRGGVRGQRLAYCYGDRRSSRSPRAVNCLRPGRPGRPSALSAGSGVEPAGKTLHPPAPSARGYILSVPPVLGFGLADVLPAAGSSPSSLASAPSRLAKETTF